MQKDVMKDKAAVAEIARRDKASAALARKVEEDSAERPGRCRRWSAHGSPGRCCTT
ncbi:hypothetical protein [Kribbella capetownensis]|uniref:hypothetical protein n=1 Tax=Kribbella capetownensis TaxID=1572659 RepID=UPI0013F49665|nr:hypothetical protein [Kribbella capetownensis]